MILMQCRGVAIPCPAKVPHTSNQLLSTQMFPQQQCHIVTSLSSLAVRRGGMAGSPGVLCEHIMAASPGAQG